jgi:hypothetical protein
MQEFYFFLFLACQILHVLLPDILVHCALIDDECQILYIWTPFIYIS